MDEEKKKEIKWVLINMAFANSLDDVVDAVVSICDLKEAPEEK